MKYFVSIMDLAENQQVRLTRSDVIGLGGGEGITRLSNHNFLTSSVT